MSEGAPLPPGSTGAAEQLAAGVYQGIWKVLAEWFDVPREPPEMPRSAAGGHYSAFKPAPGYLAYITTTFWIFALIACVGLFVCWVILLVVQWWVALLLAPPAVILGALFVVPGYVTVHLKYDTAWYVMTDRSVRIRRGVWIVRETTITFENVQNVKVQQGPLQRHFGIADVTIETAGAGAGGGQHGNMPTANRGVIEGVDNAQEIRDLILTRLRASTSAGLGDEDRVSPGRTSAALSAAHVELLREIRSELAAINAS